MTVELLIRQHKATIDEYTEMMEFLRTQDGQGVKNEGLREWPRMLPIWRAELAGIVTQLEAGRFV